MNRIICLSIFISFFTYPCNRSVDPNRAVIFVDTNINYLEIEKAKEAACERGESFHVIPHGYEAAKKVGLKFKDFSYLKQKVSQCGNNCDEELKTTYFKAHKEAYESLSELKRDNYKGNRFNYEDIQKSLSELAEKGIKPSALIVSGHDGGGKLYGDIGNISRFNMINALKESFKNRLDLLEELDEVHLWGCYSSTPGEVFAWRSLLPDLNILGGFDGSGPAREKDASGNLLKDILIKGQHLYFTESQQDLEKTLLGLENFNFTYAGVFARICNGNFYIRNSHKNTESSFRIVSEFDELDNFATCKNLSSLLNVLNYDFGRFFEGEIPLPEDTSSGELRNLYSNYRAYEHCISDVGRANQAGLLLFYADIKENFLKVFKNEKEQAVQQFEQFRDSIDWSHERRIMEDTEEILNRRIDFNKIFSEELTASHAREIEKFDKRRNGGKKLKKEKQKLDDLLTGLSEISYEGEYLSRRLKSSMPALEEEVLEAASTYMSLHDSINDQIAKSFYQRRIENILSVGLQLSPVIKGQLNKIRKQLIKVRNLESERLSIEIKFRIKTRKLNAESRQLEFDKIVIQSNLREFDRYRGVIENYQFPTDEEIKSADRSTISRMSREMSEMYRSLEFFAGTNNIPDVDNYRQNFDRYLWQLDSNCMEMLDWHEVSDTHLPARGC